MIRSSFAKKNNPGPLSLRNTEVNHTKEKPVNQEDKLSTVPESNQDNTSSLFKTEGSKDNDDVFVSSIEMKPFQTLSQSYPSLRIVSKEEFKHSSKNVKFKKLGSTKFYPKSKHLSIS